MSRRPKTFEPEASPSKLPLRYTDLYNQDTLGRSPYQPRQRPTVHSLATIPSDINENTEDQTESNANNDLTTGEEASPGEVDKSQIEIPHDANANRANESPADLIQDRVKIVDESAISNLLLSPDSHKHTLSDEDYYSSDSLVTERTEPNVTKVNTQVIKQSEFKIRTPPPVAPKKNLLKSLSTKSSPPEEIPLEVIPSKESSLHHHASDPGPPPGHLEHEPDTAFVYPYPSEYSPLSRPLTATELDLMDRMGDDAGLAQTGAVSTHLARHTSDTSKVSSTQSYRGAEDYPAQRRHGDASLSSSMRNLHGGGGELSLSPSIRSLNLSRPGSMKSLNRTPGSSESTLNDREMILESYLEGERNLIPIYDPEMAESEIDYQVNDGFVPEPDSPTDIQRTQTENRMLKVQDKFVPERESVDYDPLEMQQRPSVMDSEQPRFVLESDENPAVSAHPTFEQPHVPVGDPNRRRRRGKIVAVGVSTALLLVAITIGMAVFFAFSTTSGQPDDNSLVILNCPEMSIVRYLREGRNTRKVTWIEPTTESDGDDTIQRLTPSHQPGTFFPEGETTVVYTFYDYTTQKQEATCIFRVIILPTDHQADFGDYNSYPSDNVEATTDMQRTTHDDFNG